MKTIFYIFLFSIGALAAVQSRAQSGLTSSGIEPESSYATTKGNNESISTSAVTALDASQGVGLTHTCAPLSFKRKTGATQCTATLTNSSSLAAITSLNIASLEKGALVFKSILPPGTVNKKSGNVQWSGTLAGATAPQVVSIDDITGNGPGGGYLPLSAFGTAPISGVADESIINFNVPTFYYGGEAYSRIGVVSNGYIVIGGGTSEDISSLPQNFPNVTRPNNVIAPFWTDLDPSAGGAIRIEVLTDAATSWIVIDFDSLKNFSDATTHTGEIWIRVAGGAAGSDAASEQITISYGVANASLGDLGSGINWGAENRDGTSGRNISSAPADNSEFRPILTGPTPGGSTTITYDASASRAGVFHSVAKVTSNQNVGSTEVAVELTVTP